MEDLHQIAQPSRATIHHMGQQVDKFIMGKSLECGRGNAGLLLGKLAFAPLQYKAANLHAVDRQKDDVPRCRPIKRRRLARKEHDPECQPGASQDTQA